MATLTTEDGSGLANANSFGDDAGFTTWATNRGYTLPATAGARVPFLVLAADYLNNDRRLRWRGSRKSAAQALCWPRTGVVDRDGLSWADNAVPWRVARAQYILAHLAYTGVDLQPMLERGGRIASESIGPISVSYAPNAPAEPEIVAALGALEPLLWTPNEARLRSLPTMTDSVIVDGFEGEYVPENVSP